MNAYYKIIFTLSIAFGAVFVFNRIVSEGNKRYSVHNYQKLDVIIDNNAYYDILFIGSSRMHTSINPKVIDSITGLTAFNAGIEGAGIPEFKMIFETYLLKHPPPKKIFLGLDDDSFDTVFKFLNYKSYLYFLDNRVVDTTLSKNGFFIFPYKLFPPLKIIELDDVSKRNAIAGFFGENELGGEFQYEGYLSNGNECIPPGIEKRYFPIAYKMDQKSLSILNSIIQKCKANHIELILVYLPEYNHQPKKFNKTYDVFIRTMDSISLKNRIPFLRHDSLPLCYEKCYFPNYGHLNKAGAQQYSIIFAKWLTAN